jgi:hypothetical protein
MAINDEMLRDWNFFNFGGSRYLASSAKEAYFAEREKYPESRWYAERAAVAAEDEYIISLANKVRAGEALPSVCACRQSYYTEREILRREKAVLKRLEKNEKNRRATVLRKIKLEEGKIALLKCKEQFDASWSRAEEARAQADEDIPLSTLRTIKRDEQAKIHNDKIYQAHQDEAVKSLAGLPMDIADIIFKKHAVLHVLHCEELVEGWINAMTKYMINGRKEDKDKASDIQRQLRNTKSAIVFTHTTNSSMKIDTENADYIGSLCISQELRYTIGVSEHCLYSTKHKLKLPSLTQLGDPANKNMRFEVDIHGVEDRNAKNAKMIKTAGELFDIMQHEKPYTIYSYYADVGVCAKNVRLCLQGCSTDNRIYGLI